MTTRLRAVTDDADEFTSSSTFMAASNLQAGLEAGRTIVRRCPRMHVVVCVKQIPDPAEPGKLEG